MTNQYRLRVTVTSIFFCAIAGGVADFAHAWGSFAHYYGAPAALYAQVNLPDMYGDSWYWTTGVLYVGGEVKPIFAWSHGCQRMGVTDEYLVGVIPLEPTQYATPAGVELPGMDMYHLVYKMSTDHRAAEDDYQMLNTAKGWVAHNVMDKEVHFTFFEGGSLNKWRTQHRDKEKWADHELFALATGYPTNPWGTYVHGMASLGHAGIVNLSQKCYRKNAQSVDGLPPIGGTLETITVQSRGEISGLISSQHASLQSMTYTKNAYEDCVEQASDEGWSVAIMLAKHALAKLNAQNAVNAMP